MTRPFITITLISIMLIALPSGRRAEPTDSIESRDWWNLLKKGQLNLADTTVIYPRFLGFCVNVYNWADKTFNSYDTDYVTGTGAQMESPRCL